MRCIAVGTAPGDEVRAVAPAVVPGCPQACSTPCCRGCGIGARRAGDGDTGPAQRPVRCPAAGSGTIVGSEENMHTTSVTPSTHSQLPAASAEAVVDLGQLPTTCAFCVNTPARRRSWWWSRRTPTATARPRSPARRWRPARPNSGGHHRRGASLRRDGITAPVLAWLHPPGTDFRARADRRVQIGVSSVRQVEELLDAVDRTGRTAELTIKVDTGLNRMGSAPRSIRRCSTRCCAPPPARGDPGAESCRTWPTATSRGPAQRPAGQAVHRDARRGSPPRRRFRGGAPVELAVGDDPAGPGVRHGAPRYRGVRAEPDPRPRRHGPAPGHDALVHRRDGQAGAGRRGSLFTATVDRRTRHQPGAVTGRVCRRCPPRPWAGGSMR